MIKIGINENVYLHSASTNDKGTLEIVFKQLGDEEGGSSADMKAELEDNPFADWEKGESTYSEGGGVQGRLLVFPFDGKASVSLDPTKNKPVDGTEMRLRIGSVRDPLNHILNGYMTKDKIKLKPMDMFLGTGIDTDMSTYATKIMSEAVQERTYKNIVDNFIEQATPFLNNPALLFRLKLPRQSKAKAFPSLPGRFISDNSPFYEPMEVDAKSSKVAFTAWEIANGFNSDAVVEKSKVADKVEKEPEHDPFANA